MKNTSQHPTSTSTAFQKATAPNKQKTPIEFYLLMAILVLALLYFIAMPFM
jgi:hypothetical protein